MTTASKSAVTVVAAAMAAVLCTQMAYAAGMADPEPIVVWDGAKASYNFSTLTKKIDDNTYTLSLNEMNSVAADGSYVQIGSENAKAAITITAVNDDTSITNAFGTDGTVTVIMKYTDLPVSAGSNRALISLLDSQKYKGGNAGSDNSVKIGVSDFTGTGYFCWQGGYYSSFAGANFAATEQTAALTYSSTDGTAFYLDGVGISTNTGLKAAGYTTPCGIALGGVDTDDSNQFFAMTGMKIKAVAIFTSTLTAEQIANYKFPSEAPISVSLVSEINDIFGQEDEIDVILADGATITGDTKFNASTVRFHCNGSFELIPPEGNTAVLDFSGVTGRPVIIYNNVEKPTVSDSKFFTSNVIPSFVTDSTQWTGVIYIASATNLTDFTSNAYGNESSVVRLGNVSGWLRAPGNYAFTNTVPVELVGTLTINNGNSANDGNSNRCTVFKKLSGSGGISTDANANKVVVVIQDASEFTGSLGLNNGKYIVFGEAMPDYATLTNTTVGTIFVMPGATVTNNGFWWATGRKVIVGGELRASDLSKFGGGTYIETTDTGVFTLVSNGNGDEAETNTDYARITGTGALKYEGSGWRALSVNNFPTNMTLINERQNDILLSRALTYTIGSLAGSKNFQGNYGNGNRYLRILQAKDTEWSGLNNPDAYSRLAGFIVAPGASTAGTLTLSGTQTQRATLTVESGAKVNLTGTWVGATTVAGTLGGTGAITGDLTLSDGATLKVNDIADPLTVTGALTASSGTVTVDLPAGTPTQSGVKIISATGTITTGAKFKVTIDGEKTSLRVIKKSDFLKAVLPGLKIILR